MGAGGREQRKQTQLGNDWTESNIHSPHLGNRKTFFHPRFLVSLPAFLKIKTGEIIVFNSWHGFSFTLCKQSLCMIFYVFTSGSYNEKLWGTLINFMKSFNFIMKTSKLKTYGLSIQLFLYVSFWSGIYFQSSYNVKSQVKLP